MSKKIKKCSLAFLVRFLQKFSLPEMSQVKLNNPIPQEEKQKSY
jgi:hypothetical protein